jgi:hypothetical protein
MGRPIKEKFFGNTTSPYQNTARGGRSGVGGEKISALTVTSTGTLYSQGTTVSISAPNIAGGIPAAISQSIDASGGLTVTVTNVGSGYTTAPTLTVTTASVRTTAGTSTNGSYTLTNVVAVTGLYAGMKVDAPYAMQAGTYISSVNGNSVTLTKTQTATTASNSYTFTDVGYGFTNTTTLTSSTFNAIQIISYVPSGSSGISGGDIMKQEGSRRYLVQNAQGQGICKLTTGTLTAGTMHIIATDAAGDTYWVTKLTGRKANVYPRSNTGTSIYSNIRVAPWTIGNASGTTTGTAIISLSHTI